VSDSTVAQSWPVAGGYILLVVDQRRPSARAIALLGPVVAAIEEYRTALARYESGEDRL